MKRKSKKGRVFTSYEMKTISSLLYTGGKISISHNDSFFVSPCGKTVNFIEYSTGEVIHTLSDFEHEILTLSLSHDDRKLAISLGNGDVQIFSTVNNKILRILHFTTPAVQLDFDPTSPLLALGFGNGVIRVYDFAQSKVIFNFTQHAGRIGMVKFHPKEWYLVSSSLNGLIISNLKTGKFANFKDHIGVVLGVCFLDEGKTMVTTAVDKMLCVYSLGLGENAGQVSFAKKFPCFEDIVDLKSIPKEWMIHESDKKSLFSAGNQFTKEYQNTSKDLVVAGSRTGNITIWDCKTQQPVWKYQPPSNVANPPLFQHSYLAKSKKEILFTTEDCNFTAFSFIPKPLTKARQILGFDEEIMDIVRTSKNTFATATTGNEEVLIFDMETKDSKLLRGHTDLIYTLAISPDRQFLISGGKDRSIRIWHLPSLSCCGIADGHTDSVTTLSFSPKNNLFVSGSDDRTIKLYSMKDVFEFLGRKKVNPGTEDFSTPVPVSSISQVFAHRKNVTGTDVSVDGGFLCSCSSDKTAKLYRIKKKEKKKNQYFEEEEEDGEEDSDDEEKDNNDKEDEFELVLHKTLDHPKGVWCCQFSTHDKVIATGGVDKKIRIFSVSSGSIVKLLEGHHSSVFKIGFLNFGTQLMSAASDGIMKLWIIKTGGSIKTWEAHRGSIWGMDISREDEGRTVLTCGEDSKILRWDENSKDVRGKLVKENAEQVKKIQLLENLLRQNKYVESLVLAIELDQPRRTYKILERMIQERKFEELDGVIKNKLGFQEVNYLFQYCVDWNTNSRYYLVSHTVLNSFFRQFDPNFVGWNYEKSLDSLLVYGDKHIKRLEKLIENSFVLDYTMSNMNVIQDLEIGMDQKEEKKKSMEDEEEEEEVSNSDSNDDKKRKRDGDDNDSKDEGNFYAPSRKKRKV